MSNNKCPACQGSRIKKNKSTDREIMYKCENCGLTFSHTEKNTERIFYEKLYTDLDIHNPARFDIHNWQKLFLKRHVPGKLLDVACGSGFFLNAARKKGFAVFGIDFDRKAIEICRDYFGISSAINGDIYHMSLRLGKFDFVTMYDVLEHVTDPKGLVRLAREKLNDGGILAMSVPNINRKPDFVPRELDAPPHHLTRWSEKPLRLVLEKNGFKIDYFDCHLSYGGSVYTFLRIKIYERWKKLLKGRTKKENKSLTTGKNLPVYSFMQVVQYKLINIFANSLSILLWPLGWLLGTFFEWKGDHLYVEARKI